MSAAQGSSSGLLGRGPYFWVGMFLASSLALGVLAFTGAIEARGMILVLTLIPIALLFAVMGSAAIRLRAKRQSGSSKGQAQLAYIRRVAVFTSLYLAAVALLTVTDDVVALPYLARFAIALLPGLAIIGFLWAIGRLMVEEQDEFMRMLTVRQSLIATGVALSAASVWGFLESAVMVPHLDAYWVAAVWFFGLIIGAAANRVQHGTWGAM